MPAICLADTPYFVHDTRITLKDHAIAVVLMLVSSPIRRNDTSRYGCTVAPTGVASSLSTDCIAETSVLVVPALTVSPDY